MRKALLIFISLLAISLAHAAEIHRATAGKDGVQRVQILGGGYFFRPGHLIVKVNVPVELTLSREVGIVPHNLVIQAPEANVAVDQDLEVTPKTVTFTPTLPGRYAFYCDKQLLFLPSHREKGMEGVLEVVE
jgi:plastocyanin